MRGQFNGRTRRCQRLSKSSILLPRTSFLKCVRSLLVALRQLEMFSRSLLACFIWRCRRNGMAGDCKSSDLCHNKFDPCHLHQVYPVSLEAENAALSRRRSWVQIPYRIPSFVSVSKRSHAIKVCSNYRCSKRMRVRCPADRLSGIGMKWSSSGQIPSNVPSPSRLYIIG